MTKPSAPKLPIIIETRKDQTTFLDAVGEQPENFRTRLTGNGDFYLHCTLRQEPTAKPLEMKSSFTLHAIPDDKGQYQLKIRLESRTYYENGKEAGHAEPGDAWHDAGRSDDKENLYAKILGYYQQQRRANY